MSSREPPKRYFLSETTESEYHIVLYQLLKKNFDVLRKFWALFEPTSLNKLRAHPRDSRIQFYDEILLPGEEKPRYHVYVIDGDPDSHISCTTFLHDFFGKFNADFIIDRMMASPKWPESPYFGMTAEEIKEKWEINRVSAASEGSAMHESFERWYNGARVDRAMFSKKEWQYFVNYLLFHSIPGITKYSPREIPYRTEWEIFDEESQIAGSIDMLYEDPDRPGYLIIKDWKRSKEIKWSERKKCKEPISHLPDCNGFHYSLQVNLYKWILEKNYGVKISRMFLVRIHPDAEDFEEIEAEDMQAEIQALVQVRLDKLASSAASQTGEEKKK